MVTRVFNEKYVKLIYKTYHNLLTMFGVSFKLNIVENENIGGDIYKKRRNPNVFRA